MWIRFSLLSLWLLAIAGCSKDPPPSAVPVTPVRSHYIRRTNADTVIVFVHGIFGDAHSTWTNAATHAYWPELLTKDDVFQGADIYVHAFSSPYLSNSYTIDELIENMRLIFESDEVFQKHKQVVFVCHSMGGLATRGYLRRYQERARQVPLIYFFATPTAGSHITHMAQLLSQNPQIKGMLPVGAGEYVSILQRDWRALPVHIPSRCAYEGKDTHGIRIVDEASATALCDGPVDPIEADHIEIVKPKDTGDLPYRAFRQAFQSTVQNSAVSSSTSLPSTPSVTTGALIATRGLKVTCGQQAEGTEQIAVPAALKPEQHLVDAVVSLQQGTNLKEQKIELTDRTESAANVHYRLVGLDRNASGGCAGEGSGTMVVAFLISEVVPPVQTKGQQQPQVRQQTKGDMSPAIAGVQGNVTIVHNAEPEETAPPKAPQANKPAGLNPLELATTPALQGVLIEQITEGKLSPTITGVSGGVVIRDNVKPAR